MSTSHTTSMHYRNSHAKELNLQPNFLIRYRNWHISELNVQQTSPLPQV